MNESQKVYIKGVPGRGAEVIKALEDRGGRDGYLCSGKVDDFIYYINHKGNIDFEYLYTEIAKIIMDNYREIKLPEQWKPKKGERYWFIGYYGQIKSFIWNNDITDINSLDFGNCFRTDKEAMAKAERIKKLLKGE